MFGPKELSHKLKKLSLEGNKLTKLDVYFGMKKGDEYDLVNVKLEQINLSSNMFKIFPYKSLRMCKTLR